MLMLLPPMPDAAADADADHLHADDAFRHAAMPPPCRRAIFALPYAPALIILPLMLDIFMMPQR